MSGLPHSWGDPDSLTTFFKLNYSTWNSLFTHIYSMNIFRGQYYVSEYVTDIFQSAWYIMEQKGVGITPPSLASRGNPDIGVGMTPSDMSGSPHHAIFYLTLCPSKMKESRPTTGAALSRQ